MKNWLIACMVILVAACGSAEKDHPDVSHLPGAIVVKRFDTSLAAADTANMAAEVDRLQQSYPQFFSGFMANVLGIPASGPEALTALKAFQSSYHPVFSEADSVWKKHEKKVLKEVQLALQLAQHYCPGKQLPQPFELITFVGPMDAYEPFGIGDYGDVSTPNGAGVALQFYLGKQSGIYEAGMESGVMYDYQVERFTPEMIPVNTAKNIVLGLYPYTANGDVLVNEMIEKGKRMYLLKLLLPNLPDSLQMGYTAKQWQGSIENEALIWNFFVKGDLLYSKEPSVNQFYIHDGPMTQELGDGAPGYIGLFLGRRMVEAYMEKNSGTSIAKLMAMPAAAILQNAAYNPK